MRRLPAWCLTVLTCIGLLGGMSIGGAASFMLAVPSKKITNLGALKIVLGLRRFLLYIGFVMAFSLKVRLVVNLMM